MDVSSHILPREAVPAERGEAHLGPRQQGELPGRHPETGGPATHQDDVDHLHLLPRLLPPSHARQCHRRRCKFVSHFILRDMYDFQDV